MPIVNDKRKENEKNFVSGQNFRMAVAGISTKFMVNTAGVPVMSKKWTD
jgi:hypothetical protein